MFWKLNLPQDHVWQKLLDDGLAGVAKHVVHGRETRFECSAPSSWHGPLPVLPPRPAAQPLRQASYPLRVPGPWVLRTTACCEHNELSQGHCGSRLHPRGSELPTTCSPSGRGKLGKGDKDTGHMESLGSSIGTYRDPGNLHRDTWRPQEPLWRQRDFGDHCGETLYFSNSEIAVKVTLVTLLGL